MERIEFRIELWKNVSSGTITNVFFEINLNEDCKLIINQYKDNSIEMEGCVFQSDFNLLNHIMRYAQNIIKGKFKVPSDCKSVDIVIEHGKKDTVIVNK